MSESTSVDLGEQIAHALAARRPQPSRDFEARLENATEPVSPSRPSSMTGVLAIAAVVCAIVVVVVTRPGPALVEATSPEHAAGQPPPPSPPPPAPALPHDGNYTANQCNMCHRQAPVSLPAAHEPKGSFPLLGRHRDVACATCHAPNKQTQPACSSCHTPGTWKIKQ